MKNAIKILLDLEERLAEEADGSDVERPIDLIDHIYFKSIDDRLHVRWYGDCFSVYKLLEVLRNPTIASCLGSVFIDGPDSGANGTRNWNLETLVESDVTFPELTRFAIERNKPEDHNRSIVGRDYDEDGVLAKLLDKSPQLQELCVPSAPNSEFFGTDSHPLEILNVDAGYDTQDFIRNLSRATCFPKLRHLEFGEYNETHMEDWRDRCTPLAHYKELFESPVMDRLRGFVWKNSVLSIEEMKKLKGKRRDPQILLVRTSSEYL